MNRSLAVLIWALAVALCSAAAQDDPVKEGAARVYVTGSVFGRAEAWNWFEGDQRDKYVFGQSRLRLNFLQQRRRFDWEVELDQPSLFGLPDDAFAQNGAPLGLGAIYFAANGERRNLALIFPKQALISVKGFGANGSFLRLGRFAFNEGEQGSSPDYTLAWLKRQRVSRRLIGDADWTGIGRSFDGVHFSYDFDPHTNLTAMAARPTQGVYDVHGVRDLDVEVLYTGLAREFPARHTNQEIRAFAIGYRDHRNVLKIDNRPLAVREADHEPIFFGTFGGNYLIDVPTLVGTWDLVVWGALQHGNWGKLAQRAESATMELGWQVPIRLRPWLRAGIWYASGDHHPGDDVHGTFFQMLPSQRWYARLPYYAMQNLQDYYGQAMVRVAAPVDIRAEIHKTKLDDHTDFWYDGSGAFQPSTFGYTGVLSFAKNGKAGGLGNYVDTSIDWEITPKLRLSFYVAAFAGKAVTTELVQGRKAGMAYSEFEYRF